MPEMSIEETLVWSVSLHRASLEHRGLSRLAAPGSSEGARKTRQAIEEIAGEASMRTKRRDGLPAVTITFARAPSHEALIPARAASAALRPIWRSPE